tara:strand:- start:409 stop:525 length:117 start_codon:yes stop_codon:yes gene_type:complete
VCSLKTLKVFDRKYSSSNPRIKEKKIEKDNKDKKNIKI